VKLAVVAPSPVPFTLGGAERAWNGIVRAVNDRSEHACELLKIPTPETDLSELVAGYRRFAHLDVAHFDRVISSKYPAWLAPHDDHLIYLFHRLRGLYDTYPPSRRLRADVRERRLGPLLRVLRAGPRRDEVGRALDLADQAINALGPDHPQLAHPGPVARELVHWLDAVAFAPAPGRPYLSLSATVRAREQYFPAGVDAEVLYLPSDLPVGCTAYDDFFTASRLDGPKRLDLLITAYRSVPGDRRLRIAGTGPDEDRLRALAAPDPRIELLGFVSDADLAAHYAAALAVPFVPADEDWGLVSVEAMGCAKAVITCTDSGGPAELVGHDVTGFVTAPRPDALAAAMTRLATEAGLAERLGEAGRERASRITWDGGVRRLTATADRRTRAGGGGSDRDAAPGDGGRAGWRRPGRPKLVVLSTFAVAPALGGGQIRALHLYGALTTHFDIELLCLAAAHEHASCTTLAPGLHQTVVPRSAAQQRAEETWERAAGVTVSDIVAGELVARSAPYLEALRDALHDAQAAVLAHPYLLPALDLVAATVPVVYDAHNCELALKEMVLAGAENAAELLARVAEVEGEALRRAVLTTVCSPADAAELATRYPGTDVDALLLVPNGADVATTPFTSGDERDRATAAFLGRYGSLRARHGGPPRHLGVFFGSWHPPNIEAAKAIVAIAPEVPETVFVLGGGHAASIARRGLPANVAPAGIVSEATKLALLRAATVALNPMVTGSGTNLKLVEALAAGAPVVSTITGARGLPVVDGEHLRLTTAGDLATAVAATVVDPARHLRAAAGRALVEREYDWRTLGGRLADVLADRLA
jgi:glycosyltransferase involved in cell wall biosynthesis